MSKESSRNAITTSEHETRCRRCRFLLRARFAERAWLESLVGGSGWHAWLRLAHRMPDATVFSTVDVAVAKEARRNLTSSQKIRGVILCGRAGGHGGDESHDRRFEERKPASFLPASNFTNTGPLLRSVSVRFREPLHIRFAAGESESKTELCVFPGALPAVQNRRAGGGGLGNFGRRRGSGRFRHSRCGCGIRSAGGTARADQISIDGIRLPLP